MPKIVTDMMAEKLVSKFCEILDEKGHLLKVGGPGIGRSWSWPDLEASGEEFVIDLTVRRVDRESRMTSGDVAVGRAELRGVVPGAPAA